MRTRALAAFVLLLLPVMAEAQIRLTPRIWTRVGPGRNEPLPPQAPVIAREMSYVRMNYSVESYPMIAHYEANGFLAPGATYGWTSFGGGTRVDYKVRPAVSVTMDMTSSFLGGPMMSSTAELGTRLRRPIGESRLYPFLDVRLGYLFAMEGNVRPLDVVSSSPSTPVGNGNWSQGVGPVAGTGAEYLLTNSLSAVGSASFMSAHIQRHSLYDNQAGPTSYRLNAYRFFLGVRWNPGKWTYLPQRAMP